VRTGYKITEWFVMGYRRLSLHIKDTKLLNGLLWAAEGRRLGHRYRVTDSALSVMTGWCTLYLVGRSDTAQPHDCCELLRAAISLSGRDKRF